MIRTIRRSIIKRAGRGPLKAQGGLTLPRTGLLLHLTLPNAYLPIDWDEELGWESPMLGYQATPGDDTLFAAAPQLYDGDADTPLILSDAEVEALTNEYHIIFSTTKGLAVYGPYTTSDAVINKAHKYIKDLPLYDDTPTAYFNGVDITGSTSFDSGTLGTNPGQWVLDNTGVLVNAGVDVPAMQGMRLDGTTWRDTAITGEAILPSVNQATRTGSTDFSSFTPSTTFKKYTRTDPLVMPGYLSEPARTNKCTCRKANPVDTTNVTKAGNASGAITLVTETLANLQNAVDTGGNHIDISGLCSSLKVYEVDNTLGGSGDVVAVISGACTNLNAHSARIFASSVLGTPCKLQDSWTGSLWNSFSSTVYTEVVKNNLTPGNTGSAAAVAIPLGRKARFILPQLEEGAFCTSPIAKLQDGTDPLTAITRAGTVLAYPTAGKIRSNNTAFRMTVVPGAGGQSNVFLLGSFKDSSNELSIYLLSGLVVLRKRLSGTSTAVSSSKVHATGVPLRLVAVYTEDLGMQISTQVYSGGTWSTWVTGAVDSTASGKANAIFSEYYQPGSLNSTSQFTGNISELDTLFIPTGITDPLAWAKAQWGLPA